MSVPRRASWPGIIRPPGINVGTAKTARHDNLISQHLAPGAREPAARRFPLDEPARNKFR